MLFVKLSIKCEPMSKLRKSIVLNLTFFDTGKHGFFTFLIVGAEGMEMFLFV